MDLRTTFALAQSDLSHAAMRAAACRREAHPSSPVWRWEYAQAWKEYWQAALYWGADSASGDGPLKFPVAGVARHHAEG